MLKWEPWSRISRSFNNVIFVIDGASPSGLFFHIKASNTKQIYQSPPENASTALAYNLHSLKTPPLPVASKGQHMTAHQPPQLMSLPLLILTKTPRLWSVSRIKAFYPSQKAEYTSFFILPGTVDCSLCLSQLDIDFELSQDTPKVFSAFKICLFGYHLSLTFDSFSFFRLALLFASNLEQMFVGL